MNGRLKVRELTKIFDSVTEIKRINLDISAGELVSIIGPSGCGKTTLLRLLTGLEKPDHGEIFIDSKNVTDLSPENRGIAMVFQSETLFPDMTVRENVAFGLREQKTEKNIDEMIDIALLRLDINTLQHRYPDELSGGQQRRVALARALVLKPALLLLDEPLSGVDYWLRDNLVRLIKATQRRFQLTTLYVTHNYDEALSIADRVIVMRHGQIEQIGSPHEVYLRPKSSFVAEFIGQANLINVEIVEPGKSSGHSFIARVFGGEQEFLADEKVTMRSNSVLLVLRSSSLKIKPTKSTAAWTEVTGSQGVITESCYYGSRIEYLIETEHGIINVRCDPYEPIYENGSGVLIEINAGQGWLILDK